MMVMMKDRSLHLCMDCLIAMVKMKERSLDLCTIVARIEQPNQMLI